MTFTGTVSLDDAITDELDPLPDYDPYEQFGSFEDWQEIQQAEIMAEMAAERYFEDRAWMDSLDDR